MPSQRNNRLHCRYYQHSAVYQAVSKKGNNKIMKNTIEEKIEEFDKYLSKSAPSMDKFEKAGALNYLRKTLHEVREGEREKRNEEIRLMASQMIVGKTRLTVEEALRLLEATEHEPYDACCEKCHRWPEKVPHHINACLECPCHDKNRPTREDVKLSCVV